MDNIGTIKILSVVEQVIKINWDTHEVILEKSKILNSKIVDEENKNLKPIKYQLSPTEVKWGIISLGKKHPLSPIYKAGEKINVDINGKVIEGKFHLKHIRIDGLTKVFNQFEDLEARVFTVEYNVEENTLKFTEI